MRLPAHYAIIHESDRRRWVTFNSDGSWATEDRFRAACLLERDQATGFLAKPGVDPRYRLVKIQLTAVLRRI